MIHIFLTEQTRKDWIQEAIKKIKSTKTLENITLFPPSTKKPKELRPKIIISAEAYLKMQMLTNSVTTEIAWHGTVYRNQTDINTYYVSDIIGYPQIVSGGLVETDEEKYAQWACKQDMAIVKATRLQGHSHVNMSTSESGIDTAFYNQLLQIVPKNDFYIFVINNKSGNYNWMLYDLAQNLYFENKDIDVDIEIDDEDTLSNWIKVFLKENIHEKTKPNTKVKVDPQYTKYRGSTQYDWWKNRKNAEDYEQYYAEMRERWAGSGYEDI